MQNEGRYETEIVDTKRNAPFCIKVNHRDGNKGNIFY